MLQGVLEAGTQADLLSLVTLVIKFTPILFMFTCVFIQNAPFIDERRRYAECVCAGLLLSMLSELTWSRMPPAAYLFAGSTPMAYAAAFGVQPACYELAALVSVIATLYICGLVAVARVPVPMAIFPYVAALSAMLWRGIVKPGPQSAGAVLLSFSDAVLGYCLYGPTTPHSRIQLVSTSTYYLGQALITISALRFRREREMY